MTARTLGYRAIRMAAAAVAVIAVLPGVRAGEMSYAASHGRADYRAEHLLPGAAVTLVPPESVEPVIALTFDDGPDIHNDPALLAVLAEHKVPATFFVIGRNAHRYPALLKAISDAGHEIGNHTWDHTRLITQTAPEQAQEMARTSRVLAREGITAQWFRPPYGSYDEKTGPLARAAGMDVVLWTVDSQDYRDRPPEVLEERVVNQLTPGAVVLMHSNHANTVTALPGIIRRAQAAGYRFVTLAEWKSLMTRQTTVAQKP